MLEILKFIIKHPLNKNNIIKAIWRFITWQVVSRIWNKNGAFVYNWIDNSKLIVSSGMTGATGNMYVGLMEYEDMSFLLHYLQKDDLFYDVGANVGVYTVLAAKVKKVKTISVEPLPDAYEKLIDNIYINRLDDVVCNNIGLSDIKSTLLFTTDKDTMNSVATSVDKYTKEINVDTLDNLVSLYGTPNIVKIDVEGYETNVLNGAISLLGNSNLEVIILELNGSGDKYGYSDDNIHLKLKSSGFISCAYNPFNRELIELKKYGTHNTIYIRKNVLDKISMLLKKAKKIDVNGVQI